MRTLIMLVGLFAVLFLCVAVLTVGNARATSIICDPQAGVTHYKVSGDPWWTAPVAAQADGSIRTDVSGIPAGVHNISVVACKQDAGWGELCSSPAPFTFTRPSGPSAITGIKLVP